MESSILPPSLMKRTRREISASPVVAIDAEMLVSQLNQAVTRESRLQVLTSLFQQVGYNYESRYCRHACFLGSLVETGAVNALCLQLGFVLNKRDSSLEELEGICRALGLLLHCSDQVREFALEEVGSDLFTLLVKAIHRGDCSTRREIVAGWHSAAHSNAGTAIMIKCRGLMGAVSNILRDAEQCSEAAMESIGLLKRLTYSAEEPRLQILEQPGMLNSLACLPFAFDHGKALEWLSSVFRNLAVTPSARVVMAQNKQVLSALIRLANQWNNRTTRNILCTLDCLTMESDYCVEMVTHGDGILLNVLRRLVLEESDEVVRRRAARALRLLARDKAIPLLISDSDLMDTLASCALHDVAREVRTEAANAFTSCAALVRAPMPQHDAILKALTTLAGETNVMPDIVAKALKDQALHPLNRVPMADHMGLLAALASIAIQEHVSVVAKGYAMSALYDLSTEEANRVKMATPEVLEALVKSVLDRNNEMRVIRDHALKALLNLSSIESNRKQMAAHDRLLKAFVHYAATAPGEESKRAVKGVIMKLVPLL